MQKLYHQFLVLFPLSVFLLPESVSLLYLLLADCSVIRLPAVLVFLDSLHLVFLHLDFPAVPASDLDSPVALDSLALLASDPDCLVFPHIPNAPQLRGELSLPKLLCLLPILLLFLLGGG